MAAEKKNTHLKNTYISFIGVRYNAEKKKVGNYYTTPIYRFRMKCHLCDNHFEIETDPKVCKINKYNILLTKQEICIGEYQPKVLTTDILSVQSQASLLIKDVLQNWKWPKNLQEWFCNIIWDSGLSNT